MLNNKTKKNVKVRRAKTFKKSKNIKRNNTYNKQHGGEINTTTLDHYWFTQWPDHGAPKTKQPYIEFITKLYAYIKHREQDLNMIIHCSAGVGRTGTVYITLYLLSNYGGLNAFENKDNGITVEIIIAAIINAREHRMLIVQTIEQLFFLCQVFNVNDVDNFDSFKETYGILFTNNFGIAKDKTPQKSVNIDKTINRYNDIRPYNHNRIKLSTTYTNPNDYINASLMPQLQINNIFVNIIAAQGPTKESTQDFLRMCVEQRISLIVMVTGLTEGGQDKCYNYIGVLKDKAEYSDFNDHNLKDYKVPVFNKYEIQCVTENNNVCTPTHIPNTMYKSGTKRNLGLSRNNIKAQKSGKTIPVINTNNIFGTKKNQSGTTHNNNNLYGKLGNPEKGIPPTVDGKLYIPNNKTNIKPETKKQGWWSKTKRFFGAKTIKNNSNT